MPEVLKGSYLPVMAASRVLARNAAVWAAVKGLKCARGGERLGEDFGLVDAGDDDGDGLREAVVERFHGVDGTGAEDVAVAEGLHGEDAGSGFLGDGDDVLGERAEVGVHGVDGHLHGIEVEAVLGGDLEHAQVNLRVLVAGEADVAELAGGFGGHGGVDGAVFGEDAVGVFKAEDLVELDEVNHVGVEAAERLFELLVVVLGGAGVELGHEEGFLTVAVLKALPMRTSEMPSL